MLFKYGLEELINAVTLKEMVCQRKKDHFLLRLEENKHFILLYFTR